MRLITRDSTNAFINCLDFSFSNMTVICTDEKHRYMYLHGNLIAMVHGGEFYFSNCGWETNTTFERLTNLLDTLNAGWNIYRESGEWIVHSKQNGTEIPYDRVPAHNLPGAAYPMIKLADLHAIDAVIEEEKKELV